MNKEEKARSTSAVIPAGYAGDRCPDCGKPIGLGEPIQSPTGTHLWMHEQCAKRHIHRLESKPRKHVGRRAWSDTEVQYMKELYEKGVPPREIAVQINRTGGSISTKVRELNLGTQKRNVDRASRDYIATRLLEVSRGNPTKQHVKLIAEETGWSHNVIRCAIAWLNQQKLRTGQGAIWGEPLTDEVLALMRKHGGTKPVMSPTAVAERVLSKVEQFPSYDPPTAVASRVLSEIAELREQILDLENCLNGLRDLNLKDEVANGIEEAINQGRLFDSDFAGYVRKEIETLLTELGVQVAE